MEKYENFDEAILGLENEVKKFSKVKIQLPDESPIRTEEINIISSSSIPKINVSKLMYAVPFILFFLFYYFKPNFIMINNPHDKKGKRINYGKLIITVTILSGLIFSVKYSV